MAMPQAFSPTRRSKHRFVASLHLHSSSPQNQSRSDPHSPRGKEALPSLPALAKTPFLFLPGSDSIPVRRVRILFRRSRSRFHELRLITNFSFPRRPLRRRRRRRFELERLVHLLRGEIHLVEPSLEEVGVVCLEGGVALLYRGYFEVKREELVVECLAGSARVK